MPHSPATAGFRAIACKESKDGVQADGLSRLICDDGSVTRRRPTARHHLVPVAVGGAVVVAVLVHVDVAPQVVRLAVPDPFELAASGQAASAKGRRKSGSE